MRLPITLVDRVASFHGVYPYLDVSAARAPCVDYPDCGTRPSPPAYRETGATLPRQVNPLSASRPRAAGHSCGLPGADVGRQHQGRAKAQRCAAAKL